MSKHNNKNVYKKIATNNKLLRTIEFGKTINPPPHGNVYVNGVINETAKTIRSSHNMHTVN
jgi:hypothetical protein